MKFAYLIVLSFVILSFVFISRGTYAQMQNGSPGDLKDGFIVITGTGYGGASGSGGCSSNGFDRVKDNVGKYVWVETYDCSY